MKLAKVLRVISTSVGELPIKEGGGSFKPSGAKRETQQGEVAENTGFVETATHAILKVKLNASLDPSVFINLSSDNLTIFLAGGGQHVMPNAWLTETPELGAGEYDLEFHCAKSQKMV
ncbi:MAG: phage tail tube protein [Treponemataceae bacterium]